MLQFLIHAFDGTDAGALERRMAARPAHLAYMKAYKDTGNYVVGGAILDAEGRMIGSTVILQFETAAEFDTYRQTEPYILGGVWQDIKVFPVRVAPV
jgi:uncharacterized protein